MPFHLFARRQFAAPLGETLGKHFPWAAAHEDALRGLFASYVEAKQRQSVLDYDDLLLYFAQMLDEPEISAEIAGRFDHLLVDEYQDTNRLQAEIALALRPRGRGLTVVGDDAQSIYSFRAATVRNILDFPSLLRSARARGDARPQLPLDPADPRGLQRGDRPRPPSATPRTSGPIAAPAATPALVTVARGGGSGAVRRFARAGEPRGGPDAEEPGGAVPRRASFAPRSNSN